MTNLYRVELNTHTRPTEVALATYKAIIDHIPGILVADDMKAFPEGRVWTIRFPILVVDWDEIPRHDNSGVFWYLFTQVSQALIGGPHGGSIKPIDITEELEAIANGD